MTFTIMDIEILKPTFYTCVSIIASIVYTSLLTCNFHFFSDAVVIAAIVIALLVIIIIVVVSIVVVLKRLAVISNNSCHKEIMFYDKKGSPPQIFLSNTRISLTVM